MVEQIKLKILGGGREVGRNGVLVEHKNTKLLLDYGVQVSEEEPGFPLHVRPRDIDAIFITHSHLDHIGAVPLLYISEFKPLFATQLTLEVSELLILDFLKVAKYYVPYEVIELEEMLRAAQAINFGDKIGLRDFEVRVLNAGHILGSSAFLLENEVSILYTGDYNTLDTCLVRGAEFPKRNVDVLITEATYGLYDHPPRRIVEEELKRIIEETIDRGGKVLIPAFSVGRSQEVLCLLTKLGLDNIPIYLDGMARTISSIYLSHKIFLKDSKLFEKAMEKVHIISGRKERKKVLRQQAIIISPAGMLKGGPAVYYLKRIARDEKNTILFVSFQAPGTRGKEILNTGLYKEVESSTGIPIRARIEWLDLSSHVSRSSILDYIKSLAPTLKYLVIIHASPESGEYISKKSKEDFGIENVYFPENGEEIVLEV